MPVAKVEWSWELEHEDRKREAKEDSTIHGAQPFLVDRKLLKDVVKENLETDVGRIRFLSSGTFHKAYLVTLCDGREVIARVARRFMPHLKTESEVATLAYLRRYTNIPVPIVYTFDSNPFNRLGGEYIIMSKAKGVPLATVYQDLTYHQLNGLLENLASLIIPLFAHRFSQIGSLYHGPEPNDSPLSPPPSAWAPTIPTPTLPPARFPLWHSMSSLNSASPTPRPHWANFHHASANFHIGKIISWPFFGSGRGDLQHPVEIDRGPWASTEAYFVACMKREEQGVLRENEGTAAPHRLHLDPDEIRSSRHHHTKALPEDKSDDSDEWDRDESEEESFDWPGDAMYRDYRRQQRSAFLISTLAQREQHVREEMARFLRVMHALGAGLGDPGGAPEEFSIDCHDLSLENIFVDGHDPSKITCIIDWESTTIRPLWQCAHLPAFLQSSPFTARLFRNAVTKLTGGLTSAGLYPPNDPAETKGSWPDVAALAAEWLHYEAAGPYMRQAHRCIEWDGWEEGVVDSIIGPPEQEEEWIREAKSETHQALHGIPSVPDSGRASALPSASALKRVVSRPGHHYSDSDEYHSVDVIINPGVPRKRKTRRPPLHATAAEKEREKGLSGGGDEVELGRRLEALLTLHGNGDGSVRRKKGWESEYEEDYEAEAE
ncbi:hypothetical protein K488DRAFT_39445 [Vararia minispora EC-137]|uniref:Uncharacterized protein n=1 Tax=Vararia minispora EC-137 TaxID=1314806 RepID=A0ACB8R042_9AGAM|nr:hypothetical protein K488DRAFT_39445 [Vararia minispora EC-137]